MAVEWTNLAEAFVAGGFPWISQFRKLRIHFEVVADKQVDGRDFRTIFNFFASLFATSIYGYSIYAHPMDIVTWPRWWVFILGALALTVAYLGLFLFYSKDVRDNRKMGIVLTNFGLYIGIFCCLTAGFGVLRVLDDYYVLRGEVVDIQSGAAVPRADIGFEGLENYHSVARTDDDGEFVHLIEKPNLEKINRVVVTKDGYQEKRLSLPGGFSLPPLIKQIDLNKE